jgi:hypothetical protein
MGRCGIRRKKSLAQLNSAVSRGNNVGLYCLSPSGWQRHSGTTEIEKLMPHPHRGCICSKRIPRELQPQQAETMQNARRLTQPLSSTNRFWLLGSRLEGRPLLQTVANCFRRRLNAKIVANCYKLLQSVARRKKNENLMSRCASAIPLQDEGQNAGNVDGHDPTPDPEKIKI